MYLVNVLWPRSPQADTHAWHILLQWTGNTQSVDVLVSWKGRLARLLQQGLHNTVSELIEGHLFSQRLRLTQTPAGLALLKRLHVPCQSTASQPLPHQCYPCSPLAKEYAP